MRKRKNDKNQIAYLSDSGILSTGSPEAIAAAKRKYWSEYKKQWIKSKRKHGKTVQIFLTIDQFEIIKKRAKQKHTTATTFIKHCALSDTIHDPIAIGEIRKLLMDHYTHAQSLTEKHMIPGMIAEEFLNELLIIEKSILDFLKPNHQS